MPSELPILLQMTAPLRKLMPYVGKPTAPIRFHEKCLWTAVTLLVYLIACQVPLYGVIRSNTSDPLHWFRTVLVSNRYTLMELGITPIMTSSMVLQLLVGMGLLKINQNDKAAHEALSSAQKLFSVAAVLLESAVLLKSGLYGTLSALGAGNVALIVLQLVAAGLLVLLLDEMLESGYGWGSGISLFIATNVCERVFWKAFSPTLIQTASGVQFEGAVVELVSSLRTFPPSLSVVRNALLRENLVNISNLAVTAAISLLCIYLQEFRYKIPLTKTGVKGTSGFFPLKLVTSSNLPLILLSSVINHFHFVSRVLSKSYGHFFFVRFLGRWALVDGYHRPIGGLAYYIFPVNSLAEAFHDPLHFLAYVTFVIAMCSSFSLMWLDFSGVSPKKIAQQIDAEGLVVQGKRRADTLPYLTRYIQSAAVIGGVFVGLVSLASQLLNSAESGTSVLMAVNLIYNYYQSYRNEQKH